MTTLDLTSTPKNQAFAHEISEKEFMTAVMEESKKRPVLVQFKRGENAQARGFKQLIESAASPLKGKVSFVLFDTEKNPSLATQLSQIGMPVQSATFCAIFSDQRVKDVLPFTDSKKAIQYFLEKTLSKEMNDPSSELMAEAQKAFDTQKFDEACALYSQLLEHDENNPKIWSGFLLSLLKLSEIEACEEAIETLPDEVKNSPEIEKVKQAIAAAKAGAEAAKGLDDIIKKCKSKPDDLDLQFELAQALEGAGKKEEAADALLGIIQKDPHFKEDKARLELLRFFESWGHIDPATLRARRKLSSLLFA